MRLVWLLLICVSCGVKTPEESPPISTTNNGIFVDAELEPFYDTFMQKMDCFNKKPGYTSLTMGISSEPLEVAGYCQKYNTGEAIIVVDGATFRAINDVNRERIIYHELGHCALGLEHVPGDDLHIMAEAFQEQDSDLFASEYDFRIREFFDFKSTDCQFSYTDY